MKRSLRKRIVFTEGVCGGDARVDGTRITVWFLEQKRRFGNSIKEIRKDYPWLNEKDIEAAWEYAEENKKEISEQIKANNEC